MHTANGACIKDFGLMRCGDKIEEQVQQQAAQQPTIRLCQEGPDGSEDCADDVQAGKAIQAN